MEKISLEKFNQLPGVMKGMEHTIGLYKEVQSLEVGEALFISLDEWKSKTPPTIYLRNKLYRMKTVKKFKNKVVPEQGWSILRVK